MAPARSNERFHMEKRTCKRYFTETPIVCSHFRSVSIAGNYFGKMLNYCSCGMYVELTHPCKQGAILVVKTQRGSGKHSLSAMEEGFRSVSLAEVRWTKAVNSGGSTLYATGLKYF